MAVEFTLLSDGRPVALPYPHEASGTLYSRGCRCDECRGRNTRLARERRHRARAGKQSGFDHLDAATARGYILEFRAANLTWKQITEITGIDGRSLSRIASRSPRVDRLTEDTLRYARDRWIAGRLVAPERGLVDARLGDWMLDCLLARGWTAEVIADEIGWTRGMIRSARDDRTIIHRKTLERIRAVFLERHLLWGPSSRGRLRLWRRGAFFSDCYDWDRPDPDFRPIPGSLHPDLVDRAIRVRGHIRPDYAAALASKGQFPDQRCCDIVNALWEERIGGREKARCAYGHTHRLPVEWRPVARTEVAS